MLTSVSTFSHAYCQGWECGRGVWSDRNLKQNITPVENSLDKVSQLNGVNFEWKKNSQKDIGVIAQDVEKVFPELVHNSKVTDESGTEKTFKQVNYAGLVGVLIEAVKELKKENQVLRDQFGL